MREYFLTYLRFGPMKIDALLHGDTGFEFEFFGLNERKSCVCRL